MPYKIEQTQNGDFFVVYHFIWDDNARCEVFWSKNKAEAQAKARSLNKRAQFVEEKLDAAFAEISDELKGERERVLDLVEIWLKVKRFYFKQGVN